VVYDRLVEHAWAFHEGTTLEAEREAVAERIERWHARHEIISTVLPGGGRVLDVVERPEAEWLAQAGVVSLDVQLASDVRPEVLRWLMHGFVPLGKLTLLAGLPNQGKTTLAMLIAALLTRGALAGDLHGTPANVLIASMEDDAADTLVPRAMAAGADLKRVRFVTCKPDAGGVIDLARHRVEIDKLMRAFDARLLIIDPLVAALPAGSVNSHRDADVRSVLAPLGAMAQERNAAVVAVMHYSKERNSALEGVNGSIALAAAARSLMVFGADPRDEDAENSGARVLASGKANLTRKAQSLECRVESRTVDGWENERIPISVVVLGEACDVTADELVAPKKQKDATPREKVEEELRAMVSEPHSQGVARGSLAGGGSQNSAQEGGIQGSEPRATGLESGSQGGSQGWSIAELARAVGRDPRDGTVKRAVHDLADEGVLQRAGKRWVPAPTLFNGNGHIDIEED
jgi:putative DNA primase/helicase